MISTRNYISNTLSILQCGPSLSKDSELIQPQSCEGSTSGYHSASVSVDGLASVPTDRPVDAMFLQPSSERSHNSEQPQGMVS